MEKINVVGAFQETLKNKEYSELWQHYSRLFEKTNPLELAKQSPINQAIDQATGYADTAMKDAFEFFVKYIWMSLPHEAFNKTVDK